MFRKFYLTNYGARQGCLTHRDLRVYTKTSMVSLDGNLNWLALDAYLSENRGSSIEKIFFFSNS